MNREGFVATAAGFLLAGAVFAVMFWLVDAEAVVRALSRADAGLLAVVALTIVCWNASWGVALWNVLQAQGVTVQWYQALLVNAAGAFANHVTPFGQAGGEPVTAWLLSRTADTDYEVGLASVASLDAINVVPSLSFAALGATYYVGVVAVGDRLGYLPVAVVALALVVPVVAVLVWRQRRTVERYVGAALARLWRGVATLVPRLSPPRPGALRERVEAFVEAVERVASDRPRLAAALAFSALGWLLQSVGLWVTFVALDAPIPAYVAFFVVPMGTLGSVFPTPGGLGGIEAINVTLITIVTDVAPATVAAAVTIHSVGGYLLTNGIGALATGALGVRP